MRRRVVVTGMGCINPLGNDVEAMWAGVKEGKSGVGYTTIFDASKFPTKLSAEVKNWDITQPGADADMWKYRARHSKFACGAASQDFNNFSRMMTAAVRPDGLDLVACAKTGLEILNPIAEIEQEPNMP